MAKTFHTQIKQNDTVSALVSISTAMITATTTATTTAVTTQQATYSASAYSLNNTFIDSTIDQYFESKLQSIASTVGTDMQEKFKSYTDNVLDNKQKLITDQISLETKSTKDVLEVNNTIFNELFTKSQLINDTWNEISEDAMTIDKDSVSQMASNLLLNYSMFDSIFENYSKKLKLLQEFNGTITDFSTQLNTSSTLNLGFLQNSTEWLQLKRNFTTNLQNEISTFSGKSTKAISSTSIIKRSLKTNKDENSSLSVVKNHVFRRCQKMTVIFTVMYFAFVVSLMIIERILFQLENQQVNLAMSQINDLTGQTNFTQYNKTVKSLMTTLNLSVLYPIPYQLTKLINQKMLKREPEKFDDKKAKQSKLFYCNWWIISNGVHLWLFGLLMLLVHWQIVTRLTNFEVPNLPTFDKSAGPPLYKREAWTDANITTVIEGLIDDNISLLCENFQIEVNERLIPANSTLQTNSNLKVQSADILSLWVNDTNTQFEKYLNRSSRNWQEIDPQIVPLLGTDSVNEFLNQYSLPIHEATNTNASFALDIKKNGIINQRFNIINAPVATLSSLAKRQVKNQKQKKVNPLNSVYKWGLLVTCLTILFHHMLIFIILKL